MAKSIGQIRRAELSRAAFEALIRYGIRGATLEKVAGIAGVSKGVVLHHFRDKDALFEAVQRQANAALGDCVVQLLKFAETPVERLWAVLVGNFAGPIFRQEVCHAWVSLCADVPYNRQSQRIQSVVHARTRSNLISALKSLEPASDLGALSVQITMLMDGIWLRAGLEEQQMSSRAALDEVEFAILRLLSDGRTDAALHKAARRKMTDIAAILLRRNPLHERTLSA